MVESGGIFEQGFKMAVLAMSSVVAVFHVRKLTATGRPAKMRPFMDRHELKGRSGAAPICLQNNSRGRHDNEQMQFSGTMRAVHHRQLDIGRFTRAADQCQAIGQRVVRRLAVVS